MESNNYYGLFCAKKHFGVTLKYYLGFWSSFRKYEEKKNLLPKSISPNLLPLCDCALENSKLLLSKLNNLLEQIGKKWRINRILKSCFFLVIQKLTTTKKSFPVLYIHYFFLKKVHFFARWSWNPDAPNKHPLTYHNFCEKK